VLLPVKVIGACNFTNAWLALYCIFYYLAANHGYQITASHIAFPVTQSRFPQSLSCCIALPMHDSIDAYYQFLIIHS